MSSKERFLEVIEQSRGPILRFVSVYAHDAADRDDLFQEIVFQLWRSLPSFRGESAVRTFVYRVALRAAMRFAQTNGRHRAARVPLAGIRIEAPAPGAADDAIHGEQVEALRAAIRRLDEVDRLLVTMHLEGLPHAEIASVAGITANHVAVRLGRARKKLMSLMEKRG